MAIDPTNASTVNSKAVQSHIGYDNLANILEANLKTHYDWIFLTLGGWTSVTIPLSGAYGGEWSRLRPVEDELYTDGQVWEGARKDWVWETGINYVGTDGVTYNPTGVGTPTVDSVATSDAYHVNYPLGRIIFDTPISTSSTVQVAHQYRYIQVYRADDAPWWREIQYNSHRVDSAHFLQSVSGDWSVFGTHRVQLPCVIVESVPRGVAGGFQLGDDALEVSRDVLFHVIAESRTDRNNIMDIISLQTDKSIWLYNTNTAIDDYPLDFQGSLTGTKMYPDFVDETGNGGHRWGEVRMENSTISDIEQIHPTLYEATIRTTMRIVI